MTSRGLRGEQALRRRGPSARACRDGSSRRARRRRRRADEQVRAPGGGQVERDRALVAAERLPPEVEAVLGRPVPARGVGLARVLDLDDVGAEVAEERRGQRAGEQRRRVERRAVRRGPGAVSFTCPPAASDGPTPGGTRRSTSARRPARRATAWRRTRGPRPPVEVPVRRRGVVRRPALEDGEPGDAVAVLALGPVPDQRREPLEPSTRRLGGELPLVLGRQTGAGPAA